MEASSRASPVATSSEALTSCRLEERADERTRIAFLLQLRVISQALQECAGVCKCRIFRGVSFPCLAPCCTVLRSRWCQSDVKRPRHKHRSMLQFRVSGLPMRNVGG
jgi:hypothetical protein